MPKRPSKKEGASSSGKIPRIFTQQALEDTTTNPSDEEYSDIEDLCLSDADPDPSVSETDWDTDEEQGVDTLGIASFVSVTLSDTDSSPVITPSDLPSDSARTPGPSYQPSGSFPRPDSMQQGSGSAPPQSVHWIDDKPPASSIPFTGNPGLRARPAGNRPIDYFRLLVTKEVVDLVVNRTNSHAQELQNSLRSKRARIKSWKGLTHEVFLKFLGILFYMGQVVMPSEEYYWKQKFLYKCLFVPSIMSRDTFLLILRCLHFSDEPQDSILNPLYKIQPLLTLFHNIMSKIYYPLKELIIDEAMIFWRGRIFFPQYIRNERHKYGIKLCTLCQPDGLALKLLAYTGPKDKAVGGKRHAGKVVRYLADDILGAGHALYTDDFYNSVPLTHELLAQNTYLTGILRPKKVGNPTEVMEAKLKKGEVSQKFSDKGVSVFKWRYRCDNIVISSEFDARLKAVQKEGKSVRKPEAILNYYEFMLGTDRSDQLMTYYPLQKKPLRWYCKLGIHIFHLMMNNAYLLFKKDTGSPMKLLEFRDQVILDLTGGPPVVNPAPIIRGVHLPHHVKNTARKRCRQCSKKHLVKKSPFICNLCPESPGLCLTPCFREFHNYPL